MSVDQNRSLPDASSFRVIESSLPIPNRLGSNHHLSYVLSSKDVQMPAIRTAKIARTGIARYRNLSHIGTFGAYILSSCLYAHCTPGHHHVCVVCCVCVCSIMTLLGRITQCKCNQKTASGTKNPPAILPHFRNKSTYFVIGGHGKTEYEYEYMQPLEYRPW